MRLAAQLALDVPPDAVMTVLRAVSHWTLWLPTLEQVVATHAGESVSEVALTFRWGRPVRCVLALTWEDQGVSWQLVRGDMSSNRGQVRVGADGDRWRVTWEQTLAFPTQLPGPLAATLEAGPQVAIAALAAQAAQPFTAEVPS